MSNLLVVFGATGQQGGSVVNSVLKDPELSKQFKIRAVTRDTFKPAAQALQQKGVEVVKGDADDTESLSEAMKGAHTVFYMTITVYDEHLKQRELDQGKAIADAAVAAGAEYVIYSTLVNTSKISGGKIEVKSFDVKNEVEQYIRTLPIKSAFFAPGSFMQNYTQHRAPRPNGDGTYSFAIFVKPETRLSLIDIADDTGKYVGAILAEPDEFEGKVLYAAPLMCDYRRLEAAMCKVSGKTVTYKQLPKETYLSFMPPMMGPEIGAMYQWIQDYGYFGPETEQLVEWSAKQARGKLNTFEECLERQSFNLP